MKDASGGVWLSRDAEASLELKLSKLFTASIYDQGYDVIALVPSCALMLKFEWPLILPKDPAVEKLSKATFDVSEYIVDIARKEGLAPGLSLLGGGVTVQLACHARAQNMGQKAAEMLRLMPEADVAVIERCSGHRGAWGVLKGNFETAVKVGRPVGRQALKNAKPFLASECPLAGMHIVQEMEILADGQSIPACSNYRTMLHIEKGGEAQLEDELAAYNPLIPQGSKLVASVMFEIDDPAQRATVLARPGGIENRVFLDVGAERIRGEPDPTRENTSPDGKASSVQFMRFPFTKDQIIRFKIPGAAIIAGFDHPDYGHMATLPEPVRAALAEDFD